MNGKKDIVSHVKVVVAGANGFLGSWICRILHEEHQVTGLIRLGAREKNLHGIDRLQIERFEESNFNKIIASLCPDVVILCDWWGVRNEFRNDFRQFTNVQRLETRIASLKQIPIVIGIGSQAELGPRPNRSNEMEIDSPTTKYGLAKVEARKLLESTLGSHVRLIWGRIFSTYGPMDSESWFIPSTILKLLNNQRVSLTKGEQEWSFLHAYDLGKAFRSMIANENIEGIVNVGNSTTITIFEVAQLIGNILKKDRLLDFGRIPYRIDQVMRLAPVTKTLNSVGWTPEIDLKSGISHLIGWMSGDNSTSLKNIYDQALDLNLPFYEQMK